MDYGLKNEMEMEGKETKRQKDRKSLHKSRQEVTALIQARSNEGLDLNCGSGNGRGRLILKLFNN